MLLHIYNSLKFNQIWLLTYTCTVRNLNLTNMNEWGSSTSFFSFFYIIFMKIVCDIFILTPSQFSAFRLWQSWRRLKRYYNFQSGERRGERRKKKISNNPNCTRARCIDKMLSTKHKITEKIGKQIPLFFSRRLSYQKKYEHFSAVWWENVYVSLQPDVSGPTILLILARASTHEELLCIVMRSPGSLRSHHLPSLFHQHRYMALSKVRAASWHIARPLPQFTEKNVEWIWTEKRRTEKSRLQFIAQKNT